jgi:predicted peptidase
MKIIKIIRILFVASAFAISANAVEVSDFQARSHKISATKTMVYRLFIPKNYQASTRYPLVLSLHGAGERGNDNAAQLKHDVSKMWADDSIQTKHPGFVLAPQCPINDKWVDVDWALGSYDQSKVPISDEMQGVIAILDSLGREFSLDSNRIYVTGISMGGYGTFDIVTRYPNRFAAAYPVCGAGDPRKAASIAMLPLWAVHAADDPTVPVAGSRDMINALKSAGGQPKFTEYPTSLRIGHSAWVPAAKEPGLVAWLYSQVRTSPTSSPITPRRGTGEKEVISVPAQEGHGFWFLPNPETHSGRPVDGMGRSAQD